MSINIFATSLIYLTKRKVGRCIAKSTKLFKSIFEVYCSCRVIFSICTVDTSPCVNVSDIIKWMSGCETTPVIGFEKKFKLAFVHHCEERCKSRPTVSTCDLKIKMPVHIHSEEEMRVIMISAIKDCTGFGLV